MALRAMVMKRLFKFPRSQSRQPRTIPEGRRVYAIGDVHGRLDLLDALLDKIDEDDRRRGPCDTNIIFLGDLIDRGPDSAGVVERLCTLAGQDRRCRFLMGNHEEIFLKALSGDLHSLKFMIKIGGKETVLSYGVGHERYLSCDFEELLLILREHVPDGHDEFISKFEDYIVVGDYIFVHAGLRPDLPIDQQKTSDLRWIRNDFLESKGDFGGTVVHGHNVTTEIDRRDNRIGIDTGAYASGRLTALCLEGAAQWSLVAECQAAHSK
jgi:serine/threonine protein phosphatase 1